ncbi:DUF1543 domain-containing protein [Pedobacter sp. JY14-1]|uniref:DUF1543 domain-containing protein n=1 Tax=Pedobacter sp. JY14-1 TaxID=3034151 RepID=UPI0023E0D09A|nr:DUF1543 domain-containing protein [Pedobacter sp. JY14-1]
MEKQIEKLDVAILGGGPSGLFMFKRLIEAGATHAVITIFEKEACLGCGMPYSHIGAADEHITNVSGNEIPELVTPISEWIQTVSADTLNKYHIDPSRFNEYKVLPRLLFGQYLTAQFKLLQKMAREKGIQTEILYNSPVEDVVDQPREGKVQVISCGKAHTFDRVVICTGHLWPKNQEGLVPGWFDSPYPPAKIAFKANHAIAVRGSSLTAIDAIRTLARHNGSFGRNAKGELEFIANTDSPDFRVVMHSRNGLLPAVRFHLEDTHLGKDTLLSAEQIRVNREQNDGFLELDYVFEQNFKEAIRKQDPDFYERIRDLSMEAFVALVMELREKIDPFELLKAEYREAEKSMKRRESVYWKEMLAVLSFTMNYPAKYFSAEDMIRLRQVLMPLISVVIAFVPQSSAETLMALYTAGRLSMVAVGDESEVIPGENGGAVYRYTDESGTLQEKHYQTFIDCIGQPHLAYEDIPYKSLIENRTFSKARLRFRDQQQAKAMMDAGQAQVALQPDRKYYLEVPGIAINDFFQALDAYNAVNERIYVMAVPFIGGFNPDYSGLDFCEAASARIVGRLLNTDAGVEAPEVQGAETKGLKLYMVLLGSKAPGRVIEQHDFFFGIATSLEALVPEMKAFWPEAGNSLHIDGWREVTNVEGFGVEIDARESGAPEQSAPRLFFINLGGYQSGKLEEQHYTLLTVQTDRRNALNASKSTTFFKQQTIAKVKGANAHIDEKYGIDVDDVYRIEEVLSARQKQLYQIRLTGDYKGPEDEIHLGYRKL